MKFWNMLRVNRMTALYMMAFQSGFFAFGVLMVLVINRFLNDEPSYGCMGSILAAIGIITGVAVGGTSSVRFRVAVMMGQSRRSFLLWDTLTTACKAALGWLFGWALCHLEIALYAVIYPGFDNELSLLPFFTWPVFGGVVLGICILDLAIGAIQIRFGNRIMLIIWIILCLSPMVVGQSVGAATSGRTTIISGLGSAILAVSKALTPVQWLIAFIAALLVIAGLSIRAYWDAEVRG